MGNGAAAVAFFSLLALFPAAIFGLSLLPYLAIPHLEEAILHLVGQTLPAGAGDMLTGTVTRLVSTRSERLLSFGAVFAVWSATTGVAALIQQLNVVYGVEEGRSFLRRRATALLLAALFFVLVVGALSLVVFGGTVQSYVGDHFGWSLLLRDVFAGLRWVIIVLSLHLAFALVYHLGPDVKHRFAFFTRGSVFATVGLLVASVAFKVYVSRFGHYDALYGSLGAVIVLLVWLYVAAWVTLLGGAINDVTRRSPTREVGAHAGAGDSARGHELRDVPLPARRA
jgi:membrane protein